MIETRTRPDGTKRYRVRIAGGPSKTFTHMREARQYEGELRLAGQHQRAGMQEKKGPITFAQLCELYEANFEPSAWRLAMLAHAKKRWGKVMVRAIQPEALGQWLHGLDKAAKTKSHILETLRQVLAAGVEWGYLTKSPARRGAFRSPGTARVRPINPFESWGDVLLVADACDNLDGSGPLVRFIAATGLRSPSEWRDARRSDIDRKARTMIVRGTKTANAARTIPLSLVALAALDSLPAPLRPDDLIFRSKSGLPFDYHEWRKKTWPLALVSANMTERTPYELRHTFAVLALQGGLPIDDLASIMGHSNVSITFGYYRKWTRSMADRARNILDAWSVNDEQEKEQAQ